MQPDNPFSWIEKGDRDLLLAQDALPKLFSYPDLVCYHCQQAAEKYLKSLLLYHGLTVRKTHDLEELIDFLIPFEPSISADHYNNALKINEYGILMRYPGLTIDPSEGDVLEAIDCAKFFRRFAANRLNF